MTNHKHATNKVAVVPWCMQEGERYFLLQLPQPQYNPDDEMMWGVCRGTVMLKGGDDIRDASELEQCLEDDIEDHIDTATREAGEELGLPAALFDTDSVKDHGLMGYQYANRPAYPLHVYSLCIPWQKADHYYDNTNKADTQTLRWASLSQVEALVATEEMKPGYLPILEQVEAEIGEEKASFQSRLPASNHPLGR